MNSSHVKCEIYKLAFIAGVALLVLKELKLFRNHNTQSTGGYPLAAAVILLVTIDLAKNNVVELLSNIDQNSCSKFYFYLFSIYLTLAIKTYN